MISISSLPRVEKMLIDERTMHLGSIASHAVIITAVYMTSASLPQQTRHSITTRSTNRQVESSVRNSTAAYLASIFKDRSVVMIVEIN